MVEIVEWQRNKIKELELENQKLQDETITALLDVLVESKHHYACKSLAKIIKTMINDRVSNPNYNGIYKK